MTHEDHEGGVLQWFTEQARPAVHHGAVGSRLVFLALRQVDPCKGPGRDAGGQISFGLQVPHLEFWRLHGVASL